VTRRSLRQVNLALRAMMELGIILALGTWGFHVGAGAAGKVALGLGAPAVGFGVWGLLDFRQAGALSEPLRFVQELLISGLAALAWWVAGQHVLALLLAAISIVHHLLVYPLGGRLLKS
jgi:Protein of unknown function (DUF2568)